MSNHPESKLQQACITWFRYQYPKLLLFAIPNGGYRRKTEAAIMKGEGVLEGVSDLFLACSDDICYHGLFIEMKYGKNKLSKNQAQFLLNATKNNYAIAVCYSFDEFKTVIDSYLSSLKAYEDHRDLLLETIKKILTHGCDR
jgi:hypothetical protein